MALLYLACTFVWVTGLQRPGCLGTGGELVLVEEGLEVVW